MKKVKLRLAIWTAVSVPDKKKKDDPDVKDKYSLKDQEDLGVQFASQGEYDVVKIFRWPGHSRDESDIVQALEDFAKAGRYEYHELREMWRMRAFDVLWCHNHSRLGRSFTLQSWVIENIIRSGATIYRHVGGWISQEDYGGQIALGGYGGIQERDRRRVQNDAGMTKRAQNGLNLTTVPFPHRVVRDPLDGKALYMEVDPANRLFLDHMYLLMMENVSLTMLGYELFVRYGHSNPRTGRAWQRGMLYDMLHRPTFWGHTARKFKKHKQSMYRNGWGYDVTVPVPEDVEMYRNTHEAAYEGQRAVDVQSVLRFRKGLKGLERSVSIHGLTGLVVCPYCDRRMHYANVKIGRKRWRRYLHCASHYSYATHATNRPCDNTKHIREHVVQDFIDQLLERAFSGEPLAKLFGEVDVAPPHANLDTLNAEMERQEALLDGLLLQSGSLGGRASERNRLLIADIEKQLDQLEQEVREVKSYEARKVKQDQRQVSALQDLKQVPPDQRWNTDAERVNRLLKDFFGNYCIYVAEGKILGTDLRPAKSLK